MVHESEKSAQAVLHPTIGSQTVSEEVLRTVLIEIKSILNSKPLGYVSANVANLDPVTPNYLLMRRVTAPYLKWFTHNQSPLDVDECGDILRCLQTGSGLPS